MQEIADALKASGVDIPVLVKNPVNPDLELWIGAGGGHYLFFCFGAARAGYYDGLEFFGLIFQERF